jgi:nicotinamide mononucleotide transporter
MELNTVWSSIVQQLKGVGVVEWLALFLGVLQVLLARANKIALYPTGIAGAGISMYLLWRAGLYGESMLNFYYVVMSIYGWWFWYRRKGQPPLPITTTRKKEWLTSGLIVGAGYGMLYWLLSSFTPSTVPHLDAFVTATAWAGTWLLARRKLENWILLNISNAVAIPLLYHKGLIIYSLLTLFLFIVAVQAYFEWRKKMRNQPTAAR